MSTEEEILLIDQMLQQGRGIIDQINPTITTTTSNGQVLTASGNTMTWSDVPSSTTQTRYINPQDFQKYYQIEWGGWAMEAMGIKQRDVTPVVEDKLISNFFKLIKIIK